MHEVVKVRVVDVLVEEPLDVLVAAAVGAVNPVQGLLQPDAVPLPHALGAKCLRGHDSHGEGLRPRQKELRPAADEHGVAGFGPEFGSCD